MKNYRKENEEFVSGRRLKLSAEDAGEAPSDVISSPDKVVDAIYRGILMGRFVPGQKLIEADLGLSFGVSRGPIREALKRLSAEGVVESTRHRFEMLARFRNPLSRDKLLLGPRVHFYDTLIKAGGNSQIASVMPMMRIHLLRLQVERYFSSSDLRNRIDEYAAVTEAVLSGNAPQAERAMRRHMKQARARLAKLPDEAFARN